MGIFDSPREFFPLGKNLDERGTNLVSAEVNLLAIIKFPISYVSSDGFRPKSLGFGIHCNISLKVFVSQFHSFLDNRVYYF